VSNTLFEEINELATEQKNPNSLNLDELSIIDILTLINDEDAKAAGAVRGEIPHIEKVCDKLVGLLKNGGRLFYVGAGTS